MCGYIENLNGSATLRTEDGSIYVCGGNINARSVVIDSSGDFFLAPADPLTYITQDPRVIFDDPFNAQGLHHAKRLEQGGFALTTDWRRGHA